MKRRIYIWILLPKPDSLLSKENIFFPRTDKHARALYSKALNYNKNNLYEIHSIKEIGSEIEEEYDEHHLYHWSNPIKVWYTSSKKVFIDLGGDELIELLKYKHNLQCIKKWNKEYFIKSAINPTK